MIQKRAHKTQNIHTRTQFADNSGLRLYDTRHFSFHYTDLAATKIKTRKLFDKTILSWQKIETWYRCHVCHCYHIIAGLFIPLKTHTGRQQRQQTKHTHTNRIIKQSAYLLFAILTHHHLHHITGSFHFMSGNSISLLLLFFRFFVFILTFYLHLPSIAEHLSPDKLSSAHALNVYSVFSLSNCSQKQNAIINIKLSILGRLFFFIVSKLRIQGLDNEYKFTCQLYTLEIRNEDTDASPK